jgi:hypothetical protein
METQNLQQLFWEVDEKDLASLSEKVIISRVLSHGTFAQIGEIFSVYDKNTISEVFRGLRQGAITERRQAYFKLILS